MHNKFGKDNSRKERSTTVFKEFPQLNETYGRVRQLFKKFLADWSQKNPEKELKAVDLYVMSYLHYCIPHKLDPNDLASNTLHVQDRFRKILYPIINDKKSNLTIEKYINIVSDNKNINTFLERLVASRIRNPKVTPYVIPGSGTTFKNLFDAGYIKPYAILKFGEKSEKFRPTVTDEGLIEITINGKKMQYEEPRQAALKGMGYKGFNTWQTASVYGDNGDLILLEEFRNRFEKEKPFCHHFDSPGSNKLTVNKSLTTANHEQENEFFEGSINRISIEVRERDMAARQACIAHYGAKCFICQFDFGQFYGAEAEGFIHVHHREKLSNRKVASKTDPVKDLVPLCPNCHSVVHLRKDAHEVEAVIAMVKIQKNQTSR